MDNGRVALQLPPILIRAIRVVTDEDDVDRRIVVSPDCGHQSLVLLGDRVSEDY